MTYTPTAAQFGVAALGAAYLWVSVNYGGGFHKSLASFYSELADHFQIRTILTLLTYSLIGAFFALLFTEPNDLKQALAAGLGWTGVISSTFPNAGRRRSA